LVSRDDTWRPLSWIALAGAVQPRTVRGSSPRGGLTARGRATPGPLPLGDALSAATPAETERLRRAGFPDAQAVAAFSAVIALNYGWSSFTTARDLDPAGPSHDVGATLAALPASQFPLTVAVAGEMGAYGSDEHYDFVLDQLLAGLRATAGT
jgi:hypothetical protein